MSTSSSCPIIRIADRQALVRRAMASWPLMLLALMAFPRAGQPQEPADFALVAEWGEYGAKNGQFKYPCMISVDSELNVYVADQHNHRIQKFDSGGRFLLSWGGLGDRPGQLHYPFGVAVDASGDVYVSDMDNHRLQKFSPGGEFIKAAGGYGAGEGQFKHPYGLAVNSHGIVHVIDTLNYRVQKFDRNLNFVGAWGSQESIGVKVYMPHEIAIAGNGDVLLSDRQNHRVSVFTPDGKPVRRFGDYGEGTPGVAAGGPPLGRFSEPHGVAAAPDGSIYVCDRYNYRVQLFTAEGSFRAAWFPRGPQHDSEQYVLGLAVDKKGDIYITDHYQHCVQKYKTCPPWASRATTYGAPGRTAK